MNSIASSTAQAVEQYSVEQILPDHFTGQAKKLVELIKAYYRYMNAEGNPSATISNLGEYHDIDSTTEYYLDAIEQTIASALPQSQTLDRRRLFKIISSYYITRGSEDSIYSFFRIFYDEIVTVMYPKEFLMCSSNDQSILSDRYKLRDSFRWQEFSYQINTPSDNANWVKEFLRFAHPAGLKFFVALTLYAFADNPWNGEFKDYLNAEIHENDYVTVPAIPAVAATGRFIHFGGDTREQTHIIDGDSFTIVYVDITGASVAPNRIEITGLSEINTIPSMVEYINGVASTVGGVTFVNATFNPDVSAFDSGGSVTVTADVAGLSGNAITTTQTGDLDLWDDATLTGGVDIIPEVPAADQIPECDRWKYIDWDNLLGNHTPEIQPCVFVDFIQVLTLLMSDGNLHYLTLGRSVKGVDREKYSRAFYQCIVIQYLMENHKTQSEFFYDNYVNGSGKFLDESIFLDGYAEYTIEETLLPYIPGKSPNFKALGFSATIDNFTRSYSEYSVCNLWDYPDGEPLTDELGEELTDEYGEWLLTGISIEDQEEEENYGFEEDLTSDTDQYAPSLIYVQGDDGFVFGIPANAVLFDGEVVTNNCELVTYPL